jgi:hypothetical protein
MATMASIVIHPMVIHSSRNASRMRGSRSSTAGNGKDTVTVGANSAIKLGTGSDTVTAGATSTITVGSGNDHVTAGNNSTITLGTGTDTVVFQAGIGSPTTLSETITGLSAQDSIDFTELNFATVQQPQFSGTKAGGTLTISDGTNTAEINLIGNYLNSSWTVSKDGNGGTIVVDPPSDTGTSGTGLNLRPDGMTISTVPGAPTFGPAGMTISDMPGQPMGILSGISLSAPMAPRSSRQARS